MFEMLHKKLKSLVRIGKVAFVSGGKTQSLQVETTRGETLDNVKFIEPYGFTAVPLNGAETVVLNIGANGGNPVAVVAGGRVFRLQEMQAGEVALYTDEGDRLYFKRGNTVELKTKNFIVAADESIAFQTKSFSVQASDSVSVTSPAVSVSGAAEISETLDVAGNITGAAEVADVRGPMSEVRAVYDTHTHDPVTGTPVQKMGG